MQVTDRLDALSWLDLCVIDGGDVDREGQIDRL